MEQRCAAPLGRRSGREYHKKVDATPSACFLVEMYSEALEVNIVQATPADVGAVAPLFDAYRQFYKKASNEEAARRFLFARLSKGESILFYAVQEAVAVGFVHLYPVFSSTNLTRQWILNDLYVAPESRKHGVAHALMNRAQQFAEATQADGLMLETATDNHAAQRLYERLGWNRDEEFYRYFLAL
jgi:ribosomal protein S18 acetylase RimI-like enzyme